MDKKYVALEDVEHMLEDTQIISDGEYSGYCTKDLQFDNMPYIVVDDELGEWVDPEWTYNSTHGFRCSKCREYSYHLLFRGVIRNYKFCPHCGRKMKITNV